jgi:hypothetical protein
MLSVFALLIGVGIGCAFVFVLTLESRRRLSAQRQKVTVSQQALEQQKKELQQRQERFDAAVTQRKLDLARQVDRRNKELQERQAQINAAISEERLELARQVEQRNKELQERQAQLNAAMGEERLELGHQHAKLKEQEAELQKRIVTLADLQKENALLKRDLQNIDVNLNKLELDRDRDRERQAEIERKVQEMAGRYLKDNVKSVGSSINADNYVNCKQRLVKVIQQCRAIGFEIPGPQETELLDDLKKEFERAVKAQLEREEQARIKARLREEQQLQKEIEQEMKRLEREREVVKAALEKALADAQQEHTEEVERLETRLAEAEAKIQRAVSQAQLTRSGHVYVISNIGSFGENMYKIGMTRRLEPQDRVRELGDASVPFPFDVHMMIYSEDAPTLENALHRVLHKTRVNKLNPRKEIYRTDLDSIVRIVRENQGEVEYRADPEALQYRQSLVATDEDLEVVEAAWDEQQEHD